MLFENRKQVTAKEMMEKYATSEDFKKLSKKPSFEVTADRKKIDRINGGVTKSPKGFMWRSHFMATDPKTGLKVEIRYATNNNTKVVGDRVIDNFEPRYVETKGATFNFQNNIDLGVYQFLHPNNLSSPLRDKNNKAKPKIDFIDTKKRSQAKMDKIDALATAMSHAKDLSEERLIVLAKGLGIKGLDKKEAEEVRADVLEFAMNNPKIYNEKSNTEMTYIEGRIINLIDKGVVKLSNVGSTRRWTWMSGEREGEHILDIQNVTQDAKRALINYFFSDINKHINLLKDINNDMSARAKAERDLAAIENGNVEWVASVPVERVIGNDLPEHLRSQAPVNNAPVEVLVPTREDAIEALKQAGEVEPIHHSKISKWLRENGGE